MAALAVQSRRIPPPDPDFGAKVMVGGIVFQMAVMVAVSPTFSCSELLLGPLTLDDTIAVHCTRRRVHLPLGHPAPFRAACGRYRAEHPAGVRRKREARRNAAFGRRGPVGAPAMEAPSVWRRARHPLCLHPGACSIFAADDSDSSCADD